MSRIFLTFLNLVGLILTLLPDFQIRGQVAAEEAERDHAATEAVTVSAEKENGLFVTDVNDEICSDEEYIKEISAHADGGPRSCVCSRDTPAQPPIDMSGNFPPHVSAELPSTISPNCLELIPKVLENPKI